MTDADPNYSLAAPDPGREIPAPRLEIRPAAAGAGDVKIGLVGCGGISGTHLEAYVKAGYQVAALCDQQIQRAEARRREFYPRADVYADYRQLLARDDIAVVDLATHPEERAEILAAALEAGKHVLSQKPFVLDLDYGQQMVDLAQRRGVWLAVNQNGRFAPHFSYLREAARAGWLGKVLAVHAAVQWDHNWIKDLPFNQVRHIILYDFAIHWFDFVASVIEDRPPRRVYASFARSPSQSAAPPLLAQALVEYDDAQVSLEFDADARWGQADQTVVVGSQGTARSRGPSLREQTVTIYTRDGWFSPRLEGCWFPDGFHGTMGDLLAAIESGRPPLCNARDNLRSLALCFAAVQSAESHQAVVPGSVRQLPS